jgi:ATP-binding cassette subfamily F protein 3
LVLDLERSSKVAIVGRNAAGKSTLLKLITGEIGPDEGVHFEGNVWRHPSLRIGYVSQHSVEELEAFSEQTVLDYAEEFIRPGKACAQVVQSAGGNIRQYLGGFGLGGALAHRLIGSLSGGERMRVCFAQVMSEEPQLLVMDEVTNHLDLETLDSLSTALNAYKGAIVIVSHNQGFLSGFCKELWVVEGGSVDVRHSDTESFDHMFSQYRNEALTSMSARNHQRHARATLAKRAQQQRSNTKQSTGLIP